MRNFLKRFICFIFIFSLFSVPIMNHFNEEFIVQTNAASLSQTALTMNIGETKTVILNGATGSTTWTSSNSAIATVTNGKITALKKGVTVVTAKNNGSMYICIVTVNEPVSKITLSQTSATMKVFDSLTLYSTVSPITATNRNVTWSSSNTSVAKVSNSGFVEGVGAGTATIYCRATDGSGVYGSCKITVQPRLISFYLSYVNSDLPVGNTVQLSTITYPVDYEDTYTWTSSDTRVATVDDTGLVKGIAPGTALITCRTSDGSRSISKYIYVKQLAESISVSGTTSLEVGDTGQLTATVTPASLNDAGIVSWTSSNKSVVTVTNTGSLKAIGKGTAIVQARTTDGSALSKSVFVKVTEKATSSVYVAGISLNTSSFGGNLLVGSTGTITTTIVPSNATNKTLKWTSSNTGVATVDSSGKVKGVGPGSATITATSTDGYSVSKSATITVTQLATKISISGSSSITKGGTTKLTTNLTPSNTNESLTWSSSNTGVAIVDANGNVKGVGTGTTTIKCTGSKSGVVGTKAITVTSGASLITSIKLSGNDSLAVGARMVITPTITPSGATEYRFTTSNSSVATVTVGGIVTGVRAGTVTITCEATDGSGVKATKTITVRSAINSITLNKTSAALTKGSTVSLTATVLPSTADTSAISWTSTNTGVATVDNSGKVTAKGVGTTEIYCEATDGSGAYAKCTVVVSEVINSISISGTSSVNVGSSIALTTTVNPSSAANSVVWSSSNTSVATVSNTGVVTGVKAGTTTITAKCGNKSATKTITVSGSSTSGSITIYSDFTKLNIGCQTNIDYSCRGIGASSITWSSSNTKVATVNNSGVVTCVGSGNVTITASSGNISKSISFSVGDFKNEFRTGLKEITINAGSSATIELMGSNPSFNYTTGLNDEIAFGTSGVMDCYNYSFNVCGTKTGSTMLTVFNQNGVGYPLKVNVVSSWTTSGTSGLIYDEATSTEIMNMVNSYRQENGLAACVFNQKAQDAAAAQVLTAHRFAEIDSSYDFTLHNSSQLSCYFYYGNVNAKSFVTAWKNSYMHNKAMLNSSYTLIGVTVYSTPYGKCAFMTMANPSGLSQIIK